MNRDTRAMQTLSRGRKRFTPSEKARILNSYRGSQLSQREFAAEVGISLSALQCWLRRSGAAAKPDAASAFIAIPNLLASAQTQSFSYRLQFPGGFNLEIALGFAPAEVVELCRLVQSL